MLHGDVMSVTRQGLFTTEIREKQKGELRIENWELRIAPLIGRLSTGRRSPFSILNSQFASLCSLCTLW